MRTRFGTILVAVVVFAVGGVAGWLAAGARGGAAVPSKPSSHVDVTLDRARSINTPKGRARRPATGLNEGLARVDVLEIKMFLKNVNAAAKKAGFRTGINRIRFKAPQDRYAGQLKELARIIRGEIPNPLVWDCISTTSRSTRCRLTPAT